MDVHVAEHSVRFSCVPGCGLCCATSPSVLPSDEPRARAGGLRVVRREDGSWGLPLRGSTCAALGSDRGCSAYAARPFACRAFPVQLHALDRVQADLHLGCPGFSGEGEAAGTMLRRVAEEAIRVGALDVAGARRNAAALAGRLAALGTSREAVLAAFADVDATDPRTLAGLYVAASDVELTTDDAAEAVEEGASAGLRALPGLLAEVAREEPRRDPDHADRSLGWRRLDLSRASPAAALGFASEERRPLAEHARRVFGRDLTWGYAMWLVDASRYEVSPAAAFARVLADAGAGLLLRRQLLGDARDAIASFEWRYWSLPTAGAAL